MFTSVKNREYQMNLVREPFYGGVRYIDSITGRSSCAYYPVTETERSARNSDQFHVQLDELALWRE